MKKMMEATSYVFCGSSDCINGGGWPCSSSFEYLANPSSCIYQASVVFFNAVIFLVLVSVLLRRKSSVSMSTMRGHKYSSWEICVALFNCCLGLTYLGLGVWTLEESWRKMGTALPLTSWFSTIFQGSTSILVNIIIITRGKQLPGAILRLLSVLALAFSATICALSVASFMASKALSLQIALNVLSFPGAFLLMILTYKIAKFEASELSTEEKDLCTPLNGLASGAGPIDPGVTPFAGAGFFSRMSFWWLNSLMSAGKQKTLEDKDVPKLRREDRAESCYAEFLEKMTKQKEKEPSSQPSISRTIILCHWKEILLSGVYALLKILTVSAGPLLLNAFISVAEGKSSFKYEGYVLALSLFLSKSLESVSQRQWYFRSRLIGLQVRSLLTAAIFKKQLKLSSAGKLIHSGGEIMNYVTVDAYRIGEFPYWFHQTWTTSLQLCIALIILFRAVGLATIAALITIILCVLCNAPIAKLQLKYQTKLMEAQDERLRACTEALINMKVLKLYAWETHFKRAIEKLREIEYIWLHGVQLRKSYNTVVFWMSPILVSVATFGACYFLNVPLNASNVFTFVATLRLVQDPIRMVPDVIGAVIQAKVSFARILKFLEAPELQSTNGRQEWNAKSLSHAVFINSADFSWEQNSPRPTLRNIDLVVRPSEKVAICGEVGSGKSTLLAAILSEISKIKGDMQVYGRIAYVSQTAWIQTGTIRDNVLFGMEMDSKRYQETLEMCALVKDLESFPYGDQTEIGERGVNLSGGQKQRIQLARALYQDADIYLLDDPFSAVDAHTATNLFNNYVMKALSEKSVLLVTHQVDFLRTFDSVLLMSDGGILQASSYHQLLSSSKEFQELVNAHKETAGTEQLGDVTSTKNRETGSQEIKMSLVEKKATSSNGDQLILKEERETGDIGFKPYIQYLNQNKGFLYFSLSILSHLMFVIGQTSQNFWMAFNVDNPNVTTLHLILVYLVIGVSSTVFLLTRSLSSVTLGLESSKSLFSQLLNSLFRAPMSFYDSTPIGRILSRVSSDLSVVDIDVPFAFVWASGAIINAYASLAVLAVVTWQLLFVSAPMLYLSMLLKRYYFASAKELMRMNGTTKSLVANHLAECVAGAMTIRAFQEEDRFFAKNLILIDENASPFFHSFSATEWLIQRLEMVATAILTSTALAMVLLPPGTFSSGFIGMALSYGLSLNMSWVFYIQNQCTLANYIVSVERVNQYMHIPSEAPEVKIDQTCPPSNWPSVGKVEILDLQIQYRPNAPLVLHGIRCTFEGGHKIGIVGRTGSGKTTLIGALFRMVEPAGGRILVDGIDISTIGLHDLRSRLGIIPQDPTLFNGTVRYNLDPLSQHSDQQLWEVLGKCQLREAAQEKGGLDSPVMEEGSNWSMGQRQLFCLGRALLRRSRILVLDEATASIDNATDMILQKTIRSEFADSTVITVAHRIPTVMDCTMILGISDGKVVEYDEPKKLMKMEDSLFGQLVKEYWSRSQTEFM